MNRFDFYTGEPVHDGSPPNVSSELSQQEIVQNANLTNSAYDYDPQQRYSQMQQQQQMVYPGAYGYNVYPGYPLDNFMNPPQQQGGVNGYAGNPAFQYMQNMGIGMPNQYYVQPQYSDYTYFVPGFNTGSQVLLSTEAEGVCDRLQIEMMMELEEANIARLEKQKSYYASLGYNYGNNYYGMPWMNTYYADPQIVNKYKQKVESMKKDAENARNAFNRNLSKLAHGYLDEEITDEQLDQIYSSHAVTIPGAQIQFDHEQARLASMVPIDTSVQYKQHTAEVSNYYAKCFDGTSDMNSFLRDCGRLIAADMMEEEDSKRRDVSELYRQGGAYKSLIRQKIIEKHRAESGGGMNLPVLGNNNGSIPFGNMFPTLQNAATVLEDGTIKINAPSWLGGQGQYVIKNAMEDDYEMNRNRFIQSIYRDNPRPGGGPGGG